MIENDKGFWRGYWPLLLVIVAGQLAQQADVIMVGRLGGGAPGAYAMTTRLVIVDVILLSAMGAVASTAIGEARRNGASPRIIGAILWLSLLAGLCCAAFGAATYPRLAKLLVGDDAIAGLICDGVLWYSLAAPFRFISSTSAFMLHALDQGTGVVKWKLWEFAAKAIGNFLAMEIFGLGFSSCFQIGAVVCVGSSIWGIRALLRHGVDWLTLPGASWARRFGNAALWESERGVAMHLAMLTCLTMFAAPGLGNYDVGRLNCFAAGQTLMLIVFTPLVTLMRFLAFRLAGLTDERLIDSIRTISLQGAPFAVGVAILLMAGTDALGRLYGQHGPWWTTLVEILAASIPLRYMTSILRAVLQARGSFGTVARTDSSVFWLVALPLVALGLYIDSPLVAYLALIVPEGLGALRFWKQAPLVSRAARPRSGAETSTAI
ncbi:hypothetical+protein [Methylocapsa aurea]|jgi:hypothetical protein|uniref:methanobactin export MATE transporter MbnM n=1 Tax=Methylocapsa aurea TaxID=663610 RepID=UPI003D188C7A